MTLLIWKKLKKIQDYYYKLKCVQFNFGKQLMKEESKHNHLANQSTQFYDLYINF